MATASPATAPNLHRDNPIVAPTCPYVVPHPTMVHEWNRLTFLHWPVDPAQMQALLPPGLTVDTWDGRAWVGLVPFVMIVHPPTGGTVPWLSRFCETNVRTYVTAADGTRGVWFLSLDAARLPAVATARAGYGLPYFWSAMRHHEQGDTVTYTCIRRWPGPRHATSRVQVRVGHPFEAGELTGFDHFLTARWRLYMHRPHLHLPGRPAPVRFALAQHDPWPLHHATVLELDDGLVAAAGLDASGDPVVHWSPGTTVRIGLPHLVPPTPGDRPTDFSGA